MILIERLWLRKVGQVTQVLVDLGQGEWRLVIEEPVGDEPFSKVLSAREILLGKKDPLSGEGQKSAVT